VATINPKIGTSHITMPTHLPKLETRVHKRVEKKTLKLEVQERLVKGLKSHAVEVTSRGRINGASVKGKMHGMTYYNSHHLVILMYILCMSKNKIWQTW
jgi:hypothetical protein